MRMALIYVMRIANFGLPLIEVNIPFRDISRLYAYTSPPFLVLSISYSIQVYLT